MVSKQPCTNYADFNRLCGFYQLFRSILVSYSLGPPTEEASLYWNTLSPHNIRFASCTRAFLMSGKLFSFGSCRDPVVSTTYTELAALHTASSLKRCTLNSPPGASPHRPAPSHHTRHSALCVSLSPSLLRVWRLCASNVADDRPHLTHTHLPCPSPHGAWSLGGRSPQRGE